MEFPLRNGIMTRNMDTNHDEQVRFLRGDSLHSLGDTVCADVCCKVPSGLQVCNCAVNRSIDTMSSNLLTGYYCIGLYCTVIIRQV